MFFPDIEKAILKFLQNYERSEIAKKLEEKEAQPCGSCLVVTWDVKIERITIQGKKVHETLS
jgi:hypothetical protein